MMQITDSAQAHLVRVRKERGFDEKQVARFVDNEGRVRLTFAPAAEPGDRELTANEITVLLAPEVAGRLKNGVIDARREDGKDVLVIQRPKAAKRTSA